MRNLVPRLLPLAPCLILAMGIAQAAPAPLAQPTECLLISGQIRNGHLTLDPAYLVVTSPSPPPAGEYRLELLDRQGATLLQVPFATFGVADGPDAEAGFAFALPLPCKLEAAYHGLRIMGPQGCLASRYAGLGEVYQLPTATPLGRGLVRIQWDAKTFPSAMIRDPASLEILAFAKGGLLDLATPAPALEVNLSDGVRSKRFLLKSAP